MNNAFLTRTRSSRGTRRAFPSLGVVILFLAILAFLTINSSSIIDVLVDTGDEDANGNTKGQKLAKPFSVAAQKEKLEVQQEGYQSAVTERYIMENYESLGFDKADPSVSGCKLFKDPNATNPETYEQFNSYYKDLSEIYIPAVRAFSPILDLMDTIRKTATSAASTGRANIESICETVRVHPDGLKALFPNSELSHGNSGYLEPLAPPMRYPGFCWRPYMFAVTSEYLVHDFEAMCLKLKPMSRRIFIDIGAGKFKSGSTS